LTHEVTIRDRLILYSLKTIPNLADYPKSWSFLVIRTMSAFGGKADIISENKFAFDTAISDILVPWVYQL
ncbi:MAG: hypothetical protein ACR2PH_07195, partial [Desulfobulbia bacterium]